MYDPTMTRGLVATTLALILTAGTVTAATAALAPADSSSSTPAAGICDAPKGRVVTVALTPDVPSPRCVAVRCPQRLAFRNDSDRTARVHVPTFSTRRVRPGATTVYRRAVRTYLAPGHHSVRVSLYAGGGVEVMAHCGRAPAPEPTPAG